MNRLGKCLATLLLMLGATAAFAATGIDLYWPIHDGDQATFVYDKTKTMTLTVYDIGDGEFEIYQESEDGAASLYVQKTDEGIFLSEAKVGWNRVSFNPPVVLLNNAITQKGGTVKTSTSASQRGIAPYPAVFTLKVRKAKKVRVPAGTFLDCRSIVSSETARVPGYGTIRAKALTAYLAPGVGIVKMLVRPGHWAQLVSANIGGTTISAADNTGRGLAADDDETAPVRELPAP